MQTLVTKVTERGQISIPAILRREMELHPGMSLLWERGGVNGTFILTVVPDSPQRKDARSMLGFARKFRKPRRTAEWMAESRT